MQQEYRKIDLTKMPVPDGQAEGSRAKLQFKVVPYRECQHAAFYETVKSSLSIRTPKQFTNWVCRDVQKIFPHGAMACGLGITENLGGRIRHLITGNFPLEHLNLLHSPDGVITSPVIAQWIKTRRPVVFELAGQKNKSPWLESFRRSGLQNMMVHGRSDLHSHTTSYFTFAQVPGTLGQNHANLLELLVPHLHDALIRTLQGGKKLASASKTIQTLLSKRELEVLQWLGEGKSNWEISQVMQISENTVKNHVQHILAKLKVTTRAQAVARGSMHNQPVKRIDQEEMNQPTGKLSSRLSGL